jgi:hypothetical protein
MTMGIAKQLRKLNIIVMHTLDKYMMFDIKTLKHKFKRKHVKNKI